MTPRELKRIRRELGLTQKALAERLGVIPVTVARWELGLRGIAEPIARLVHLLYAGARGTGKAADGANSARAAGRKRPQRRRNGTL